MSERTYDHARQAGVLARFAARHRRGPWEEGFAAFCAGKPVSSCPYSGFDANDWRNGWWDAKASATLSKATERDHG